MDLTIRQILASIASHLPIKWDGTAARNLVRFVGSLIQSGLVKISKSWILDGSEEPIGLLPESQSPHEPAQTPAAPAIQAPKSRPWQRRSAILVIAITRGIASGYTTYTSLIAYVRTVTGRGCSRRAIAKAKAAQW